MNNNKKNIIYSIALLLGLATTSVQGRILPDNLNYTVRLGYNLGGTAPLGMPATIRSLNEYKLQPNYLLGFDVQKDFTEHWGLMVGLRLEGKDMKVDATVKNYHMTIVRGGESLTGFFTGNNVSEAELQMLTIPVMATYKIGNNVLLKCGPYVSYLSTHNFKGHVYDGYLRETDPTGPKIEIGTEADQQATYDFSSDMRRIQWGIDFGADWNIYHRWGLYADVAWGLNGIHKSSFHTIEQTLYPIYGSLGVTYKLK